MPPSMPCKVVIPNLASMSNVVVVAKVKPVNWRSCLSFFVTEPLEPVVAV